VPEFICITCGTQFAASDRPPDRCAICDEERQYVNPRGQTWTTLPDLRRDHRNALTVEEPQLTGIRTDPSFAIGQRALLVQTAAGNVLWDCVSLLDDDTERAVRALGGVAAIAISHPHYYSSMVEWSQAFDGAPVYVHAADTAWVMRAAPAVRLWEGDTHPLPGGLTLIRCGGHFSGAAVLHWPGGAGGRGALLTGDTLQVVPDRRHVSFMYSYPNLVPVNAATVRQITRAIEPFPYERVYGAFAGRVIAADARAAVARSARNDISARSSPEPAEPCRRVPRGTAAVPGHRYGRGSTASWYVTVMTTAWNTHVPQYHPMRPVTTNARPRISSRAGWMHNSASSCRHTAQGTSMAATPIPHTTDAATP